MPDEGQLKSSPVAESVAGEEWIIDEMHTVEDSLYFERGGPYYRLMQRINWIHGEQPTILKRILGFLVLTWLPLLLLSYLEGRALGPTPRESFLLDFTTYARFLILVPILIAGEAVVGTRVRQAALHMVRGGFITAEEFPAFNRAIARATRWREALWPELAILVLAIVGASTLTVENLHQGEAKSWHVVLGQGISGYQISFTGLWYHLVAIPLLQFLLYRWLWRLLIWTRFLYDVSRLDLALVPTHADEAGGLGFLGNAHLSMGLLAFGLGAVLSANAAFRIVYEGATVDSIKITFLVLVIVCELLFLGPLLLFVPLLARTRREGMRVYGILVLRYNRDFHEKWIEGKIANDEPLLGCSDIQSLADLGNSFSLIKAMKVVPFSPKVIVQLAVLTIAPALPLLLLVFPLEKVLDTLAGAVF